MKTSVNLDNMDRQTASTIADRFFGLMGKKEHSYILCFPHCNAIHTFFMKIPLDIIMTDRNHQIVYQKENLKPWRIITPKKKAYYTYELPIHSIEQLKDKTHFQ